MFFDQVLVHKTLVSAFNEMKEELKKLFADGLEKSRIK